MASGMNCAGTSARLNRDGVISLGKDRAQERVDKSGKKETLYGWADLAASSVKREGLALVPDTERHANIRGWPADKEERRFKQQQLAMASRMVLLSNPHIAMPA